MSTAKKATAPAAEPVRVLAAALLEVLDLIGVDDRERHAAVRDSVRELVPADEDDEDD
jgi:hypothetical protein